jgi:hypothetical protein
LVSAVFMRHLLYLIMKYRPQRRQGAVLAVPM